jgi:hypothetical protein
MKNLMNSIFTPINFYIGLAVSLLIALMTMMSNTLGWDILFAPLAMVGCFVIGYIISKLFNLN